MTDRRLGIEQLANVRADHWENVMTGLGVENRDPRTAARVRQGRAVSQAEYEIMYLEDPFFARIVDTPPQYAIKNWIRLTGGDDSFGKDVTDALELLDAQFKLFDLARFSRLDGGAAMLIGANDGRPPEEPLDISRVQSVRHLHVLRRFEITPMEIDQEPTSPTFREPLSYTIGASGGTIHASRVIRLRGIYLSDAMTTSVGALSPIYWGVPIAQRVIDALRQFHSCWGHVEGVFKDLTQGVIGVKDLAVLLSSQQGNEKLIKRLSLMAMTASNFNAVLLDPEVETYEKRSHGGLTGVAEVLDRASDHLCAVAEIPKTKLFGVVPGGLGKDDASGDRTFNASISVYQERSLRRPLRRIIEAVLSAKDGPTGGKIQEGWAFEFNPIEQEDQTAIESRRKSAAETDKIHLENGVLSEKEIRSRIANSEDNPYTLDPEFDAMLDEPPEPEPEPDPVIVPELERTREPLPPPEE